MLKGFKKKKHHITFEIGGSKNVAKNNRSYFLRGLIKIREKASFAKGCRIKCDYGLDIVD